MAPLIVMLAAWLVARSVGTTGLWLQADSWTGALSIALAAMFMFTAVSHSLRRTRPDLSRTGSLELRKRADFIGSIASSSRLPSDIDRVGFCGRSSRARKSYHAEDWDKRASDKVQERSTIAQLDSASANSR